MEDPKITLVDAANRLAVSIKKNDEKVNAWFDKVSTNTDILTDDDASTQKKYDAIVAIDYLLFKIRVETEYEHLLVKQALNSLDTAPGLRSIFLKRDQYLATVIIKLNSLRDDVSVLQKVVYTKSSFNFNK